MSSEQDAVEQVMSIADALEPLRGTVIATGELADGTDASVPVSVLIDEIREMEQALEAQRRETRRITERLQEIVNKNGWEVEAWGKDTLDVIEAKLQAQDKEKERLREGLIAYEMAIQCAEHGYLPSTSAAAEVRSFVNGYEGSPEIDVEVRGWITEQEAQDE